jgi:hypothetical protein
MPNSAQIKKTCDEICALLQKKNAAYGDSAANPIRVFSKASPIEGILVRIDDKLSRIQNAGLTDLSMAEDTLLDLIGYLILLKIENDRGKD